MFVVGDKEMANHTVAVRKRGEGDIGVKPTDEIIDQIKSEIADKKY